MTTLRQLRYLASLARHRHFGRAAEECSVSQPALSVQIQELEAGLGTVLVERNRGRIDLTPDGLEIARRASRILTEVGDLVDYARHRRSLLTGPLRLGVIPSIAPYLLPDALPELKRRFPELNLQLRETITETLIHELGSGVLDLILIALPIDDPELETLHLFDDKFVLASHATKNNKRSREAALDVLAHERLLLLEEGHCLRDQALSFCRLVTPEARESFGASSLATVVQMVAHGYGITLLPEMAVASAVHDRKDIRLQHFPAPEPKREIGLAWRKTSPRKADFHAFAALLKDASRHRVKS